MRGAGRARDDTPADAGRKDSMNTSHRLVRLALAGLAALAAAAAGHPAAATAPPAPPTAPPPADWQVLVDDTGLLTVAVPPAWADLDTAPGANADGTPRPWLEASPDIASFHTSFDTAGVIVTTVPRSDDLEATLGEFDVGSCAAQVVEPYAAGSFTGLREQQRCGDGVEFHRLAVNSPEQPTITLLVELGVTAADPPGTVEQVMASIGFVGLGEVTVTSVTVPSVTVSTPGAPSDPTGPNDTVAGAVSIVDDTNRLTVAVPPAWSDVSTTRGDGPTIMAGPDLAALRAGDPTAAGMVAMVTNFEPATEAAVEFRSLGSEVCTSQGIQPYDDGTLSGHSLLLTDCAGTSARTFILVAGLADRSNSVTLVVVLTEPGDAELATVLGSLRILPPA